MDDAGNWTVIYNDSTASPWWVPWLPVVSAIVVAVVTIYVMVKNNAMADTREHDRWRKDAAAKAGIEILEMSHQSLNVAHSLIEKFGTAAKQHKPLPKSPNRFHYSRTIADLRRSARSLSLSAGTSANDAALALIIAHDCVLRDIHAMDSMIDNDFEHWVAEDGTTDPDALILSALRPISADCTAVERAEEAFAAAVREDLGIVEPATSPLIAIQTVTPRSTKPDSPQSKPE